MTGRIALNRAWLGAIELDLEWALLTVEQRGPLTSWSVDLQLATFPSAEVLNLRATEFRGYSDTGAAVHGDALVTNVQVSGAARLSLLGNGPIHGLPGDT